MQGKYALMRLPDHDRPSQMSPDGMHTLADVVSNILQLISGKSDGHKVRKCEESYGRFPQTWAQTDNAVVTGDKRRKTSILPPAPWTITQIQKVEADRRMAQLSIPSYLELRHRPYFTKPWQLDRMHYCYRCLSF